MRIVRRVAIVCYEAEMNIVIHSTTGGNIVAEINPELIAIVAGDSGPLLEDAKKNFDVLSREITAVVREDIYAMTALYEAIHEHVRHTAGKIDGLLAKAGGGRDDRGDQNLAVFMQIEQALVTLIRDYRFELKAGVVRSESAHEDVLRKKRHDLLDSIFALFERERRTRSDRRSGKDRRKYPTATPSPRERRTVKDRRSGKSRRR